MAFIPNLKNQEEAVKSINGKISEIKNANTFIETECAGHYFSIGFSVPVPNDYSDRYSTTLVCGSKSHFHPMILAYQKELASQIRTTVKVYNVSLTDEEDKLVTLIEKKHFKDIACEIVKE